MKNNKLKCITECTKKELESLSNRKYGEDIGLFDSLIILPTKDIHNSGYRCMSFVAVKDGIPICLLSGCSDVVHIDGIGGGGKGYKYNTLQMPKAWSIDCLAKSGLLNIWVDGYKLFAGLSLSSFEIFAIKG